MKRKIYLEDLPLDEAQSVFEKALRKAGLWGTLPAETIEVSQANGRVTAESIWARISSPHYNASAMDGFALRSRDSAGATETNPVILTLIERGDDPDSFERPAQLVDTGHPLPNWADAVVMVEDTQRMSSVSGRQTIEIRASLPPWRHVRLMGEDMVATELVIPAKHVVRPVDIGAIAGSGHETIRAFRKPRVAIIPTGSELVPVSQTLAAGAQPGSIIEYNSMVLAAQVEQWGGVATRWPIIKDDYKAIQQAVRDASRDHDLVLVNAGSSAGTRDFTAGIVQSLGQLLVHGIAIRPGHPVILGIIERERAITGGEDEPIPDDLRRQSDKVAIIGVPGYPVSSALTGEIFVEPLLAQWQGLPKLSRPILQATVTRKITSHTGDDDFVRVTVGKVSDRFVATPISRGAGVISSLVRADGLIRIPRFSEGLDAGSTVEVQLYRAKDVIERTIVAIGSHDLTLDLLSQFLTARGQGMRLTSANVGSLSGLVALRRGESHLAGSHLLDLSTGEYNDSYVSKYLPGQEVILVSFVDREQGWIVPRGNPRGVRDWADIALPKIRIINRQRGAGTRVLLDYQLEKLGIDPMAIKGYSDEVFTHLAVAAAVASGAVDAGLGIAAAAQALQLDFVPLTYEKYELVITGEVYRSGFLTPLLDLLASGDFKEAVSRMPGYSVQNMGDTRPISG